MSRLRLPVSEALNSLPTAANVEVGNDVNMSRLRRSVKRHFFVGGSCVQRGGRWTPNLDATFTALPAHFAKLFLRHEKFSRKNVGLLVFLCTADLHSVDTVPHDNMANFVS